MNNSIGFMKEKLWTGQTFSQTDISYQDMANPTFKEESTSKSSRRRLGLLFFAALRLCESKSREGVLGPDLRVLILLEYPGVSPIGSLIKVRW